MSAGYMRRCAGKLGHATKEEAVAKSRGREGYNVYRCDQCLLWHAGSTSGRFKTRERRSGKRANKNRRGR